MGLNGGVALLAVNGRDILTISSRKELSFEGGIGDIYPGPQSDFFVAASTEEDLRTAQLLNKSMKLRNMSTAEQPLV